MDSNCGECLEWLRAELASAESATETPFGGRESRMIDGILEAIDGLEIICRE